MKTIVVPTDFSVASENAMQYAGHLAMKVNASVYLVHVYELPVSMNEAPTIIISAEELKKAADAGLDRACQLLKQYFPSLDIQTESRLGGVADELKDLNQKLNPLAIVTGKHSNSVVDRLLTGSTILSIIRHLKVPVISVPQSSTQHEIKTVVFAIEAKPSENTLKRIKNFIETVQAQLHVIHISQKDETDFDLKNIAPDLNYTGHVIHNSEFIPGIQAYINIHKADLLMVIPHHHTLLERLFFKTHTKEVVEQITIPVVSMPED
jgi:nucleotide-binding universal stress UspA family protein